MFYKSNSYLTSFKTTKIFLNLFTLLLFVKNISSHQLKITEATEKKFFVPIDNGMNYNKIGTGVLDFSKGHWYWLIDENILEFHSNVTGFLDFNSSVQRCYKSMYLEGSKRVLVFPMTPRGSGKYLYLPYVDKSRLTDENPNIKHIYNPEEGVSLFDAFKNSELASSMDNRTLNQMVDSWNFLPYIDPQVSGTVMGNSFSNYWGALIGFGDVLLDLMRNPDVDFDGQQLENLNKVFIFHGLFVKLATFIFYEDPATMRHFPLKDEAALKSVNLTSLLTPMMNNLVKTNSFFKNNLKGYVDELYQIVFPLSEQMVGCFLEADMASYLDSYFAQNIPQIGIKKYNKDRSKKWTGLNVNTHQHPWNDAVFQYASQKMKNLDQKEDEVEVDPQELEKYTQMKSLKEQALLQFREFARRVFDNEFQNIRDYLVQNNKDSITDSEKFVRIHDKYAKKDSHLREFGKYAMPSPLNEKDVLAEKLSDKVLDQLFDSVVTLDGVTQVMFLYESRSWGFGLEKWDVLGKLGMDIFSDSAKNPTTLEWFRTLLVLVGEMSLDLTRDQRYFESDALRIFTVQNRRVLV